MLRRLPVWMSSITSVPAAAVSIEDHNKEEEVVVSLKRETTKKRVKSDKPQPQKKKKKRRIPPAEEDDEQQLTVDDLISIAQEYVQADSRKEYQQGVTTEAEAEAELRKQATTFLPSTEDSRHSTFSSDIHISPGLISNSDLIKPRNQDSRRGDSTQDMLDLFLGPLLNKPQVEQRKLEESFREEIVLQKQSSKEKMAEESPLVMEKKKSSLRDKVAMLLE